MKDKIKLIFIDHHMRDVCIITENPTNNRYYQLTNRLFSKSLIKYIQLATKNQWSIRLNRHLVIIDVP